MKRFTRLTSTETNPGLDSGLFPTRLFSRAGLTALAILTAGTLSMRAGSFSSGLIDFDYNWTEIGYQPYGPGAAATGSAGDLWNSISVSNPGPLSLRKTDGSATSVLWTTTSGGALGTPNDGGTYGRLFDASYSIYTANISGLTPNQAYTLYLYDPYWAETMSVNGVAFNLSSHNYGTFNTLTAGIDYDVHSVIADANGTLSFVPTWTQTGAAYVSSWQLAPVPEPSCLALAGVGAAALLIQLRRK